MKIRIHETDFEGRPLDCSGEFFSGKTALDIVERMSINPFHLPKFSSVRFRLRHPRPWEQPPRHAFFPARKRRHRFTDAAAQKGQK